MILLPSFLPSSLPSLLPSFLPSFFLPTGTNQLAKPTSQPTTFKYVTGVFNKVNFKTPACTEINFNAGYRLSPARSGSLLRTNVGNGYESGETWADETNTASSGGKFSSKLPLYERYPLSWTHSLLPSFLLYPFVFRRCAQSCMFLASSTNRTADRTRRCIQGEAARRPNSFLLVTRADLGRLRSLRKAGK